MKGIPMDGKLRFVIAITLVSLVGTGCAMWKDRTAKTVKIPEKPLPKPLVLKEKQNIDIQFALARTFENEQNFDKAADLYRQILEKDSKHAGATHRLAIVYDQQGLFDQSEPLFRKALELQPGDPDLFCDVGYSLYRQQKWREAEQNYRQAVAIAPNHKRAHNHLGLVLAVKGREEEALQEFHKSGCSLAEARMNLALIHSFEGRLEQARDNYELAQQAKPGSKEITERLREVETALAMADSTSTTPADLGLARKNSRVNTISPSAADAQSEVTDIETVGFQEAKSQQAKAMPETIDDDPATADDNEATAEPAATGDKWWQRFKLGFRKRSAE